MTNVTTSREQQLDILRGIAIICVVAIHSAQISTIALDSSEYEFSWVDQIWRNTAEFGKYGVELFFFISGVLLAKIYSNKPNFSLQGYTARRLGRIFPLWFVFAIGSFLLFVLLDMGWWKGLLAESGGGLVGHFLVAVSTLFFLTWAIFPETIQRAMPGGWSIESEMTHYALFPFLRNLSSAKLIYAIAICGFLAALNDYAIANVPAFYEFSVRLESLSIFTTLPFFLAGLLLVRLSGFGFLPDLSWKLLPLAFVPVAGSLLLLFNQVPFGSFAEAMGFCVIAYGVSFALKKSRIITRALSSVGKYSYFTYFSHFYVVSAFFHFQAQITDSAIFSDMLGTSAAFLILHFIYFSIALLISQALGAISFRYFESPILNWSRRIK